MAIGQDILDALAPLTAALATLTTSVDTLIANIEAAVLAGTIPADVAQAILGTIVADKAAALMDEDVKINHLTGPMAGRVVLRRLVPA